MARHFTDEETKAWLAQQPAKVISSKVVLQNKLGQVLILDSTYKEGWDFPGGVVDKHESPLTAALRETEEEIGVKLSAGRLAFLGVRYGFSQRKNSDYLHLLFRGELTDAEIDAMALDTKENSASQWVEVDDLHNYGIRLFGEFAQRLLTDDSARYSDQDEFFV